MTILVDDIVDDAEDYFENRLEASAWDDATVINREKALATAIRAIERLNLKAYTTLPTAIKEACFEEAFSLLDGKDPDMEFENLRMISQGFANVRSTYDIDTGTEHLQAGITSITAWRLVLPHIRSTKSINMHRVS